MLERHLRERLTDREILLMTHIVLGYPSFDDSLRVVESMVEAGVDLMELQIPFSEPIADGPVILHANQRSLAAGSSVSRYVACGSSRPHSSSSAFPRSRKHYAFRCETSIS